MKGHVIPYSQVFISVTMSLDEAAALNDLVGSLKPHRDPGVQKAAADLRSTLEESLEKAAEYAARKGS